MANPRLITKADVIEYLDTIHSNLFDPEAIEMTDAQGFGSFAAAEAAVVIAQVILLVKLVGSDELEVG